MEVIEAEYRWIVKNSEFCLKNCGECIVSPIFSFGTTRECKWNMSFYPRGDGESNKNYVTVFLKTHNDFNIKVGVSISISNCKTNKILNILNGGNTFPSCESGLPLRAGFRRIVNYDLVANDDIQIVCKINSQGDLPSIKALNDKMKLELLESQCRLKEFDKFGELLYSGAFSDVIIIVDEKEFKAHKNILSSKSSVFKAMFSNDVKENLENIIQIIDIDSDTMEEVLYFMYTGKLKQLSKFAMKIFVAADKYIIDGLKTICIQQISKNITAENVLETLNFAHSYDYDELYNDCIKFIVEHNSDLLKK